MGKLSTKLKYLLGVIVLFVIAVFAEANLTTFLQDAQADRFLVDGPPEAWRLNLESPQEYVAVVLAFITGPYGIGFVLGGFLFSIPDIPVFANWIRSKRSRKGKQTGWEFEYWDGVDPLTITQAAYLWAGETPGFAPHLRGAGQARYITLAQAINDQMLTPAIMDLKTTMMITNRNAEKAPDIKISREELRRFIDEEKLRPAPFVFPEDR